MSGYQCPRAAHTVKVIAITSSGVATGGFHRDRGAASDSQPLHSLHMAERLHEVLLRPSGFPASVSKMSPRRGITGVFGC